MSVGKGKPVYLSSYPFTSQQVHIPRDHSTTMSQPSGTLEPTLQQLQLIDECISSDGDLQISGEVQLTFPVRKLGAVDQHTSEKQDLTSSESDSVDITDTVYLSAINRFSENGNSSLDVQLANEILLSIKRRLLPMNADGNLLSKQGKETHEVGHNSRKCEAVKQEHVNKDIFQLDNSCHMAQSQFSYSNSLPLIHRGSEESCSISSTESCPSHSSPDSSRFQTFPSDHSSKSRLSYRQLSTQDLDSGFDVVSISNQMDRDCESEISRARGRRCSKQTNLLPPCRVCGDKASGFHYGANTCEACKGFFRRSLKKEKKDYKCMSGNNCKIQKGRRNNCPQCRYNKCISVGMSKEAIKTGRYTHEKRTQDIVEVKTLQGDFHHTTIKLEKQSPTQKTMSEENVKLLDRIYRAHKQIFPFWHKVLSTGEYKYANIRHAERFNVEKDSQNNNSTSDSPGTNNRLAAERNNYIEKITKHLDIAIKAFVRFAKAVPRFMELPINDQASLVKLSRFEIWMIGAHKFMDAELQVVTGPLGNSYHVNELSQVLEEEFVRSLFNFAQSLQDINLTNEETALLQTVVLMFSDRAKLQEPEKVSAIQLQLIGCLEELLGDTQRFSKVMNALIRLRDLTEWNHTISETILLEWPTMKHHPLLLEIMSG